MFNWFKSSPDLEIKIEKVSKTNNTDPDFYGIFIRGNPKIEYSVPVKAIIKLYDKASNYPIVSTIDQFCELNSRVFEHSTTLGNLNGKYYPNWSRISALLPEFLIAPYKGHRMVSLDCHFWIESIDPPFKAGYLDKNFSSGYISTFTHNFNFEFINTGLLEIDEERLKIQEASVKLAVSIGLADGNLDKEEGHTIKQWITKIVDSAPDTQKEKIKKSLNNSLEDGFNLTKTKEISLEKICSGIEKIGSKVDKHNLLDLCLDVMAADGRADKEELNQITKISEMIGINYEEMTKMKDQRFIKLDPTSTSSIDINEKIGIDPSWNKSKIKKHILKEYAKWNGRLNTLPEGKARDNAQSMLNLLAEAKNKYY